MAIKKSGKRYISAKTVYGFNSEYGTLFKELKRYCFRSKIVVLCDSPSQLYRIKRGKIRYCLVQ
jgi:hypothetical protein